MEVSEFVEKLNKRVPSLYFTSTHVATDVDPLICVINRNNNTLVAFFNCDGDIAYDFHFEGSFRNARLIVSNIAKVLDEEDY